MLDPIRHQLENARDTRQRLKLIFDAAIADGNRTDNPADHDTKLRPKLGKAPSAARHATITGQSRTIPPFPTSTPSALEVTALTVARTPKSGP